MLQQHLEITQDYGSIVSSAVQMFGYREFLTQSVALSHATSERGFFDVAHVNIGLVLQHPTLTDAQIPFLC